MTQFIGGFADLTGYTVGPIRVLQIAGRDRQRAPVWECECQSCRRVQVFSHAKLTCRLETRSAQETLFCQNEACVRSRREPARTETLRDVRMAERRDRKEAERIASQQRDRAAKHAAEKAAQEAALAPLRADWHKYVLNRINAGKPATEILNLKRWLEIGEVARTRIMELVAQTEP